MFQNSQNFTPLEVNCSLGRFRYLSNNQRADPADLRRQKENSWVLHHSALKKILRTPVFTLWQTRMGLQPHILDRETPNFAR